MPDKPNQNPDKNPILYLIDDEPIRKKNYVYVELDAQEFSRIVKLAKLTKLSKAKIIALSAQPCQVCGNDQVHVCIMLGQLSTKKQTSGSHNKKRKDGQ
jgi:hypothetical protein